MVEADALRIFSARPLRECDQCHIQAEPAGGIAVNQNKWVCAKCWQHRGLTMPRSKK